MTAEEWDEITVVMLAYWPNKDIPSESFDVWFLDLSEFESEFVEAGVRALARDGREWMPNGGQIRNKILELREDRGDWSAAYELAMKACTSHGGYDYGLGWLRDQDALAARTVETYGWWDFCKSETTTDGTRRAQFRDIYLEIKGSADRHDRYRGLPSAGLAQLEQANGPVRVGRPMPSLERGKEAA